eukprot:m.168138 g.168138  ORF g.168138 m.168138 type:complete len:74 (+) comp14471_c0_seq2:640-861(+)
MMYLQTTCVSQQQVDVSTDIYIIIHGKCKVCCCVVNKLCYEEDSQTNILPPSSMTRGFIIISTYSVKFISNLS